MFVECGRIDNQQQVFSKSRLLKWMYHFAWFTLWGLREYSLKQIPCKVSIADPLTFNTCPATEPPVGVCKLSQLVLPGSELSLTWRQQEALPSLKLPGSLKFSYCDQLVAPWWIPFRSSGTHHPFLDKQQELWTPSSMVLFISPERLIHVMTTRIFHCSPVKGMEGKGLWHSSALHFKLDSPPFTWSWWGG